MSSIRVTALLGIWLFSAGVVTPIDSSSAPQQQASPDRLVEECVDIIRFIVGESACTNQPPEVSWSTSKDLMGDENQYPVLVVKCDSTITCGVDTNQAFRYFRGGRRVRNKGAASTLELAERIRSHCFARCLSLSPPVWRGTNGPVRYFKTYNGVKLYDEYIHIGFADGNEIPYISNFIKAPFTDLHLPVRISVEQAMESARPIAAREPSTTRWKRAYDDTEYRPVLSKDWVSYRYVQPNRQFGVEGSRTEASQAGFAVKRWVLQVGVRYEYVGRAKTHTGIPPRAIWVDVMTGEVVGGE